MKISSKGLERRHKHDLYKYKLELYTLEIEYIETSQNRCTKTFIVYLDIQGDSFISTRSKNRITFFLGA